MQLPDDNTLHERIERYFAGCDRTEERVILKNGNVAYRQIPYTMAGLCAEICVSRQDVQRVLQGKGRKRARELLGDASRRIERYVVERALLGELASSVSQILLRDMGYGAEPDGTDDQRVVVVLDDRERWGD